METSTILTGKRDAPELLTTEKAATYVDVRPHTLEVWRVTGRYDLPFIKVGRNVRYRRTDLDRFLASRTVAAKAADA